MYILIPVSSNDLQSAKITKQSNMKFWALVNFENGVSKSIEFKNDRTDFGIDWIDFIVLENKFENYIDFMGEGMMCLVVREEQSIEEIVSAFAFKELDEIGL